MSGSSHGDGWARLAAIGAAAPVLVTHQQVADAFWGLVGKHLPLRYGRDRLFVAPHAIRFIPADALQATSVDPNLHGLEMRLERAS